MRAKGVTRGGGKGEVKGVTHWCVCVCVKGVTQGRGKGESEDQ